MSTGRSVWPRDASVRQVGSKIGLLLFNACCAGFWAGKKWGTGRVAGWTGFCCRLWLCVWRLAMGTIGLSVWAIFIVVCHISMGTLHNTSQHTARTTPYD